MTTKRNYSFTPTRDYGTDWRAYFADYRKNIEEVNATPEVETPDIITEPQYRADDAQKSLQKYATELGFDIHPYAHKRKAWRRRKVDGKFIELYVDEEVLEMGFKKGNSAMHLVWINGKPEGGRVQINGGPVEVLNLTTAKNKMLEAL